MVKSLVDPHSPPVIRSLVDAPYRQKLVLMVGLFIALFLVSLSQTVVATAAQNIVIDLGDFHLFPWLFAGFSLSAAVGVPVIGKMCDRYSRRKVILVSVGFFLITSAAACLAQTMSQLVTFRVLQGLGNAGVYASIWIIAAALWRPEDRTKWFGLLTAAFTLSGLAGPVLGGAISDSLGWRWIFLLHIPVGSLAFLSLAISFPRIEDSRPESGFDWAGATAFCVFSGSALSALALSTQYLAWTHPAILILMAFAVVGLIAFLVIERSAKDPLIPLMLFRSRLFSGAMAASITLTSSFMVVTVFIPLYVQGVKGLSATVAAFPLMSMAVGVAFGVNLAGPILSRTKQPGALASSGLAISAGVLFFLVTLGPETSLIAACVATTIMGIGLSIAFMPLTVSVQNAMPSAVLGVVTSNLQFSRMFGMAAGSAILGALLTSQITASLSTELSGRLVTLADPEVLVSLDRLTEIRATFAADPTLGEGAYSAALKIARESLSNGLSKVFTVAGLVAAAGIPLVLIAFHRYSDQSHRLKQQEP